MRDWTLSDEWDEADRWVAWEREDPGNWPVPGTSLNASSEKRP